MNFQHQRIAGQQAGHPRNLAAHSRPQKNRAGRQIADRDALQHAGDAEGREREMVLRQQAERKRRQEQPEPEDDRRTLHHMAKEFAAIRPSSTRRAKENVSETPTIHRKNGKIMSVGVQPFHGACSSGG